MAKYEKKLLTFVTKYFREILGSDDWDGSIVVEYPHIGGDWVSGFWFLVFRRWRQERKKRNGHNNKVHYGEGCRYAARGG